MDALCVFFVNQKTAYELRIRDWSSDVCSSDLRAEWWEAKTAHFVVYSESDRDDAEKFATLLERFDNALRTLQNMPVPGPDVGSANKVKVYRSGDTDNKIGRASCRERVRQYV